jgi:hypothetical protein
MQNGPTYIASYPRRFRTSTPKRYAPCHIDACHNALTQPLVAITRGFRHNPFAMLSTAPRSDAKMSLRSRPFHAGLLAAIVAVSLQLVLWSSAIAGGFGSADSSSQARGLPALPVLPRSLATSHIAARTGRTAAARLGRARASRPCWRGLLSAAPMAGCGLSARTTPDLRRSGSKAVSHFNMSG